MCLQTTHTTLTNEGTRFGQGWGFFLWVGIKFSEFIEKRRQAGSRCRRSKSVAPYDRDNQLGNHLHRGTNFHRGMPAWSRVHGRDSFLFRCWRPRQQPPDRIPYRSWFPRCSFQGRPENTVHSA